MEKIYRKVKVNRIYIIVILVTLPAVIPLLKGGFYHFSDEPHIANLYQMIRAIQSGQIPPRWAPDMSYGYGYPLFNFYYPFPYYLGSLFYFLGGSLIISLKILFLVTVPLSAILMYKWLRLHTDLIVSLVGVIVYTYTPYRAVDLYVRGALGELFAFIFFPLIAFLSYKVWKHGRTKDVGLLGLTSAVFILSHNLAPLLFFPWVVAYVFTLSLIKSRFENIFKVFTGLIIGVLGSLYFWLPALVESRLVRSETPFYFKDHFPFIKQLLIPSWGYGASNPGIYDDMSFQIGVANLLLFVFVGVTILIHRNFKKYLIPTFFLGSIFAIIVFMNIRTSFLWELFALAKYVQFPWRLLMLTTFLTSTLVIFVKKKTIIVKVFLVLLVIASFVNAWAYFKPSEYYYPNDNYFLKRFFANRVAGGEGSEFSEEYKNYSEDYLLLPLWTDERPSSLPESKFSSDTLEINNIERISSINYKASVSGSGVLEIHTYYFPGWRVTSDGVELEIFPLEPNGNIGVEISEGVTQVQVFWKDTLFRSVTGLVSVLTIGLSAMAAIGLLKGLNHEKKKS